MFSFARARASKTAPLRASSRRIDKRDPPARPLSHGPGGGQSWHDEGQLACVRLRISCRDVSVRRNTSQAHAGDQRNLARGVSFASGPARTLRVPDATVTEELSMATSTNDT